MGVVRASRLPLGVRGQAGGLHHTSTAQHDHRHVIGSLQIGEQLLR